MLLWAEKSGNTIEKEVSFANTSIGTTHDVVVTVAADAVSVVVASVGVVVAAAVGVVVACYCC